ncbi:hypothetical protein V6N13_058418 [Hibiscus sabdariffa]|uniref:Uncharacterized protein n=1 Tax=Hibiscus sabdariffa TaxID=183260 RepID=A0ABR2GG67_9ROSI
MGHPAKECGYKDEKQRTKSYYGTWLRALSSKKSTVTPVMHRRLPAARESEDSFNDTRRRVNNIAIEERQVVVPAITFEESRMVQVLPLFRPTQSPSLEVNQAFHHFSPLPSEKLGGNECWDYQTSGLLETRFWRKLLRLWNPTGVGLIENEDVVNFVFSPDSNEGPSKIISRVEKRFKGKGNGFRRLSGIKQATRAKYVKEIVPKFNDETDLLEFGRYPYGGMRWQYSITRWLGKEPLVTLPFFLPLVFNQGDHSPTPELSKRYSNGCRWEVLAKESLEPCAFPDVAVVLFVYGYLSRFIFVCNLCCFYWFIQFVYGPVPGLLSCGVSFLHVVLVV